MQELPSTSGKKNKAFLTRLSSKGQITIPKEARDLLGIQPKDRVALIIEGDALKVVPARSPLEESFQAVPALTPARTLKEMVELAAEEHAEEAAREGLP